jgi:CHAT domain-containing protein/Tfp pilus assembly protein PilF
MGASIRLFGLVALAGGMLLTEGSNPARALAQDSRGAEARELTPQTPIEGTLAGGETHAYRITLASGQYLRVVVEQRSLEMAMTVLGPDGRQIAKAEKKNREESATVSVLAESTGVYRLEVSALEKTAAADRYVVKIQAWRDATLEDRSRVIAEKTFAEGGRLSLPGGVDSLRQAIEKYQESLPHWRAASDRNGEANALYQIGKTHDLLGEHQKALDYLEQALPLQRAVGDQRGEANTLNYLGAVYSALGEKRKALDYFERTLPLRQAVRDRAGEAITLTNIGSTYSALGEKRKALDYYEQALPLHRSVGNRQGEAASLNNIALSYSDLGEKQKALDYFERALTLRRAVGDRRGEAATLTNIGTVYTALGEDEKALDYYEQALPLRRAAGDRGGEAVTLVNIGIHYSNLGEEQKALNHLEPALVIMRASGNRRGEANALRLIGLSYFSLGERQKALDYLERSLTLIRATGDPQGEAYSLDNLGWVYRSLGEGQRAHEYYEQALSLRQAIGDRNGEAITLANLARVECDRGDLMKAHERMGAALDLIESLRGKVLQENLRSSYFATRQDYYHFSIDLLMRLSRLHPGAGFEAAALQTSERVRARSLLESLVEAHADIRQGVDAQLVERERALQGRLNAQAERQMLLLSGKHREDQAVAAGKEIEALTSEYQALRAQIRTRNPRYDALTQPVPLNLTEIQQQALDADTLLLEYALGEERSFLWAVTQTSISAYELPKRAEINAAAERAYKLLAASGQRAIEFEARKAAAELSRIVLGPIASQLGQSNLKRLAIVSDGALQYVPFGALPKPAPHGAAPVKAQPMIVSHEIVSLPSASVLVVLRREEAGRAPAQKSVAVFSDPVFQPDDSRVKRAQSGATVAVGDSAGKINPELTRSAAESGLMSFERLRFTRDEAEMVVSLASAERSFKALDFAASRAMIEQTALDQYRIIHFATHGLLNSRHPELSGVVLSLVDERGRPQDGFLRAHEIYNLKLNAELVVLSACRTALGKEIKGEGLVGLTRGFMYAGAARVVASMWDVKDEATAELMKRFYQGMFKERRRPAEALRAAQVSMWKEPRWEAPYFWAGFALQGEWK